MKLQFVILCQAILGTLVVTAYTPDYYTEEEDKTDQCSNLLYWERVTQEEGAIGSDDLKFGGDKSQKWTFPGLPNMDTMLILNMTESYYAETSIKLYDDYFVQESEYCYVLKYSSHGEFDELEAEMIHDRYPNCKLRIGTSTDATLSYCPDNNIFDYIFGEPEFTIKYKVVKLNDVTATSETEATNAPMTSPDTTEATADSDSNGQVKPDTKTLIIILAVMGALVVLLVTLLATTLALRQRRKKHGVATDEQNRQLNDVYHTIPPINNRMDSPMYNEISNGWSTVAAPPSGKGNRESTRNVENPLYGDQISTHPYEYIDIKIQHNRSAR